MRLLIKIVLGLLATILLLIVLIFGLRAFNDWRYGSQLATDIPAYYQDVTDKSLYDQTIEGVTVTEIEGTYLNGFQLEPEQASHQGVIVTFGGSEGSPDYETATMLAQNGYRVLSLFFFGQANQQATLREIPLDYYEEIEDYIRKQMTETGPITIIGHSKGAEYGLLLASYYDSINHLVLYDPSAYVFAGLDFETYGSSWSKDGQALPYIDLQNAAFFGVFLQMVTKAPISYFDSYQVAIEQDKDLEDKRIKLENSQAELLVFAGQADRVWPSSQMAETIKTYQPNAQVYIYDKAGHAFYHKGISRTYTGYMDMGGEESANKAASKDSSQKLLEQLADWHPVIE